jgi:hypothetical protein
MRHRLFIFLMGVFCLIPLSSALAVSDPSDAAGGKDPDLFSRMPGFHIYSCNTNEFNRYEFQVASGKFLTVEGYSTFLAYYANDGITLPSGIQITRNYINAAKSMGGEEVYSYSDGGTEYSTIRVVKDNNEVWVSVSGANNGMYNVNMVVKQAMKQSVEAAGGGLVPRVDKATGTKSALKPESQTTPLLNLPSRNAVPKPLTAGVKLKYFNKLMQDNKLPAAHNLPSAKIVLSPAVPKIGSNSISVTGIYSPYEEWIALRVLNTTNLFLQDYLKFIFSTVPGKTYLIDISINGTSNWIKSNVIYYGFEPVKAQQGHLLIPFISTGDEYCLFLLPADNSGARGGIYHDFYSAELTQVN